MVKARSISGVAFDGDNHLCIADHGNHRVQKFDVSGKFLCQFGNEGSDNGQLRLAHGITVHKNKLYVAEEQNRHIYQYFTRMAGLIVTLV